MIRAIWEKLIGRGFGITFTKTFNTGDGSRDICQQKGCGKERRFHSREDGHRFLEKEN